ncbi:MAG: tetratricopeptide repeat protein [Candidatus Magnetominusculus sp. LBB02]|nr:tetratricopeptide repeat protein [Candidatus Magnetominusculus sp. LBB02]
MANKKELPNSPILTIMFTGIAGSATMSEILAMEDGNDDFYTGKERKTHDEIIRKCVEENLGFEVKNKGGGFMAVFEWPQDAIVSAACIIEVFETAKIPNPKAPNNVLKVRIGLHTGTVHPIKDSSGSITGYKGDDVLLAARLEAVASESQVLLTGAVKAISGMFSDYEFYPLRAIQFKAMEHPVEIYELLWGSRQPGPEPRHDRTFKYPSMFDKTIIGRDEFIKELKDNVNRHKLVTVCGIGGIGKTAVAIKMCKGIDDKYDIFFAAMYGLPNDAGEGQILGQIAHFMELPEESPKTLDGLAAAIENKCAKTPILLLIDNYEIIDTTNRGDRREEQRRAAGRTAGDRRSRERRGMQSRRIIARLAGVPCLKILVTSMVSVGIDCEKVQRLHPLDLDFREGVNGELIKSLYASGSYQLLQYSVRLHAGMGNWRVSDVDAQFVKRILEVTSGIPLAIELAAGRMNSCSWQEAAETLEKTASLLKARPVHAERRLRPDRHLSIDVCLSWSYEKLSEPAQRLFRALSLLANSFEAALIKRCYGKLFINNSIPELLEEMQTSMVIHRLDDGKWRFKSIVHIYGRELLNGDKYKSEKKYIVETAFISYWDDFVKKYSDAGMKDSNNLILMEKEHGHVVEFLLLLLSHDNYHDKFILYTNTVSEYWLVKKVWSGIGYLKIAEDIAKNKALTNPDEYQPYVAMTCISLAAMMHGIKDVKREANYYNEALQICRALSKKHPEAFMPEVAEVCTNLVGLQKTVGDMQGAVKFYEEAIEIYRKLSKKHPDVYLPKSAQTCNTLALLLKTMGDGKGAVKLYEEAIDIYRKLSKKHPGMYLPKAAMTASNLATALHKLGDYKKAKKLYEDALQIYKTLSKKDRDTYSPKVTLVNKNLAIVLNKMSK